MTDVERFDYGEYQGDVLVCGSVERLVDEEGIESHLVDAQFMLPDGFARCYSHSVGVRTGPDAEPSYRAGIVAALVCMAFGAGLASLIFWALL